jgi:ribonuclease HI
VGAAVWIPEKQQSVGCSLANWSSILTAELRAIHMAITWLTTNNQDGDVVIVSDSQSAIQALLHHQPVHQTRTDVWAIRADITARFLRTHSSVYLQWVPSHRGIRGNEEADILAGLARDQARGANQTIQFGELKLAIKLAGHKHWQQEWDQAVHGRFRYEVEPRLHTGRIAWSRRDNDVFFTRMRLGVVKTPSWRNLILKEGDGLCNRGCNDSVESEDEFETGDRDMVRDTLRHILLDCPELQVQRLTWSTKMARLGKVWALTDIFTSKEAFFLVLGFLRDSGLLDRLMY